jgi:transcription factor IIIB subunit 2
MNEELAEDEFADDPEVQNAILTEEELTRREKLWVTDNDKWLRENQEKIFQKKIDSRKPKATRRRRKRPRIGEGQLTPASTPGEAAVAAMKERAFSTRINYDAIRSLFDTPDTPGATSGAPTSYAGSTAGGDAASTAQVEAEAEQNDADDADDFEEEEELEEEYDDYNDNQEQGFDDIDSDIGGYDED